MLLSVILWIFEKHYSFNFQPYLTPLLSTNCVHCSPYTIVSTSIWKLANIDPNEIFLPPPLILALPKPSNNSNLNIHGSKNIYSEGKRDITAGCGELEGSETDVIKGLIIKHHTFISILNQLVHRKGGIVWLYDCVRNLGRRENREGHHHSIRVLLSYLWYQQCAHARSGTTTQRVAHLKPCTQNNNTVCYRNSLMKRVTHQLFDEMLN